jgi:hypothetical protein
MWMLLTVVLLISFVLFWPFGHGTDTTDSIDRPPNLPAPPAPSSEIESKVPRARLMKMAWLLRVLEVTTVQGKFTIEYNGRGLGYESVLLKGQLASIRKGFGKMSHRYEFQVGSSNAALTVLLPIWGEVMPLRNFRRFSLELDGQCLYLEST